jgi:hypothetical protein
MRARVRREHWWKTHEEHVYQLTAAMLQTHGAIMTYNRMQEVVNYAISVAYEINRRKEAGALFFYPSSDVEEEYRAMDAENQAE